MKELSREAREFLQKNKKFANQILKFEEYFGIEETLNIDELVEFVCRDIPYIVEIQKIEDCDITYENFENKYSAVKIKYETDGKNLYVYAYVKLNVAVYYEQMFDDIQKAYYECEMLIPRNVEKTKEYKRHTEFVKCCVK